MSENIIITNLAPVPDRVPLYADDTQIRPLHPQWRRFLNDVRNRVGAASGDIIYDSNNNAVALIALTGVPALSTDLGTFTGSIIPDNSSIKVALQSLETEVETKQDLLVSGTNIKTVNSSTLLGSGDLSVGTVTSVAAINLGTTGTDLSSSVATSTTAPVITLNVPNASALNRGALLAADFIIFSAKQTALVSGTNIKTVNGSTLLGSGDIGTIDIAHGGTNLTSTPTNGQLLIGNGTNYTLATITAGSGISVTNGAGTITLAGTFIPSTVSSSATYTESATSGFKTSLCDATGGAIVVNLPTAASATGLIYTVKKIDASVNTVTLDGNGAETIDGTATKVISTQYNSLTIQSDGSAWWII